MTNQFKIANVFAVVGMLPSLNILWEVAHNRLPREWWLLTKIAGAPGFLALQVVGMEVPTNFLHMSSAEHVVRWLMFLVINTLLWFVAGYASARVFRWLVAARRSRRERTATQ